MKLQAGHWIAVAAVVAIVLHAAATVSTKSTNRVPASASPSAASVAVTPVVEHVPAPHILTQDEVKSKIAHTVGDWIESYCSGRLGTCQRYMTPYAYADFTFTGLFTAENFMFGGGGAPNYTFKYTVVEMCLDPDDKAHVRVDFRRADTNELTFYRRYDLVCMNGGDWKIAKSGGAM